MRKAFRFKQFGVEQARNIMPVTTDACIFSAYVEIGNALPENVLDIGSGTGLLSLMLAQRFPKIHITAIDIDADSVSLTSKNFNDSPWPNQLHAIHGDITTYQFERLFNTIICNPPFFENQLRSPNDERNRSRHDRDFSYKGLCRSAAQILVPNGKMFLLIPLLHEKMVVDIFSELDFHLNKKTSIKSFEKSPPHVLILEFSRQPGQRLSDDITIYSATNIYSEQLKSLLNNFYLNF